MKCESCTKYDDCRTGSGLTWPCGAYRPKAGSGTDIEKLIEQLRDKGCEACPHRDTCRDDDTAECVIRLNAATAMETLQIENQALRNAANGFKAENEKLRAEVESLQKEHCAGCSIPAVKAEQIQDLTDAPKLRAELEEVKRERDAAVKDLEDLMADTEDSVCWLCAKADSTEPCRGAKGTCTPKWRGIQTDSSPYLVADEATEFNRDQWDWLLGRFTRKED